MTDKQKDALTVLTIYGKAAGYLAAIGLVLAFAGGVARGVVVREARAQAVEAAKEDREAQALVNRRTAAALEEVSEEVRESRKDTRAFYATMRQFTGIRSDRLDRPLPAPVVPDGGP